MLIEQLEIKLDNLTAAGIPFGHLFFYKGDIYMSVKPVSFLLNSTLVQENINAGKRFCVNLEKGTLHILPGNTVVEAVDAKLIWALK